jgi:hypothetical protein
VTYARSAVPKQIADQGGQTPAARRAPVPTPSGEGVVLTSRPPDSKQIALTVLPVLGVSAFITIEVGMRFATVNIGGYVTTFVAGLAAFALLWLALLGARTLERRRLRRRFPGTLVFSFARSADVSAGLRRLNLVDPIDDLDRAIHRHRLRTFRGRWSGAFTFHARSLRPREVARRSSTSKLASRVSWRSFLCSA